MEAEQRIARFHCKPEVAAISVTEMRELTNKYETSVLLEALRRAGSCVQKERTLPHDKVVKAIYNLAERVKAQDLRINKPTPKPTPIAAPRPESTPKVNPYAEELLTHWCEVVATNHNWMPLDEYMESLLRQYDADTVQSAMDSLGRTYDDTEAQAALDAVQSAIDHIVWENELTQV